MDPDSNNNNSQAQSLASPVASVISSILLADTFASVASAKLTNIVEMRRPDGKAWVMAHPTHFVARAAIVQMPEERGTGVYAVRQDVLQHVPPRDVTVVALYRAIEIGGNEFLWIVREGDDSWATSMKEAVRAATGGWVRVQSDRAAGRYVTSVPKGDLPPPVWSEMPFAEVVALGIKDRTIDAPNHPVIKLLEGIR